MSWTAVIWLISSGVCITLAAVHLFLWVRDRKAHTSLAFSLWTTAVAISALFELAMMHSPTQEKYAALLGSTAFPFAITTIAYIAFVRLYLQAGRLWLMWFIFGIVALELLVKVTVLPTLPFVEITDLQHIPLWGETLVAPVGVKSRWSWITWLLVMLELAFIVNAAVEAWRGDRKRQVKIVAVAVLCSTAFSVVSSVLVLRAELPPLIIVILPSMFTILVMAYGLSSDLIKANQLSRDLDISQQRIKQAAEAVDLSIWEWDIAKDQFWSTDAGSKQISAGQSEQINIEHFFQSLHPDDREATRQAVQRSVKEAIDLDVEYRMVPSDGGTHWIATLGHVECGNNGKPHLIRGVSINITKSKKAEEALRESEGRLREAQRIAHIGSWELNLLKNTLSWSDEVFWIFEIDREHFGASYEAFLNTVHPEDRDAVNAAYTNSLETRSPYGITHRLLMPDGRVKYVHEQCETLYSPEGKPLRSIGTVQDITALKHAETERVQLRNELAHLSRSMLLSELSASLAHEINQPLGAILNNASAAKILSSNLKEGNDEEVEQILADIIRDANRAGEIVRKIRGMVKKGETNLESLHLNILIEEVVNLYKNSLNMENILANLYLQPDLLPIRGDRISLQQVLMNLIANAMEAMRESSLKTLTIRSTMQSPDMVTVSISDSGTGIDDAKKDKVFEPFFTTKKDGLGMGLRICRSIIEEHGGRIWVENNPVAGATFSFSLKAYRGDSG